MFNIFKKSNYATVFIPSLYGESKGISIGFKNYPIRESVDANKIRKEVYPDFNVALINDIYKHIGDIDAFIAKSQAVPVMFNLNIDDKYRIPCEIKLQSPCSKRTFLESLPDAIIAAFQAENIQR